MRSGTAARICRDHYNPTTGKLTFTTKYDEKLTLPVTSEIAALFELCDLGDSEPFVRQLHSHEKSNPPLKRGDYHRQSYSSHLDMLFKQLRISLDIHRRIVPHDLRRTTAVAVYRHTRNVRKVQAILGHRNLTSTIWYLDHDLEPVEVELLETVKKPYIVHRSEMTA